MESPTHIAVLISCHPYISFIITFLKNPFKPYLRDSHIKELASILYVFIQLPLFGFVCLSFLYIPQHKLKHSLTLRATFNVYAIWDLLLIRSNKASHHTQQDEPQFTKEQYNKKKHMPLPPHKFKAVISQKTRKLFYLVRSCWRHCGLHEGTEYTYEISTHPQCVRITPLACNVNAACE